MQPLAGWQKNGVHEKYPCANKPKDRLFAARRSTQTILGAESKLTARPDMLQLCSHAGQPAALARSCKIHTSQAELVYEVYSSDDGI